MTQKEKLLQKLEKIERMEELRSEGKTYEEIAKEFGTSKQRVYQLIGDNDTRHFTKITDERCVYSGLRNYMNEQRLSINGLAKLLYGDKHPKHHQIVRAVLKGSNCKKQTIDDILAITGLSYEVAFGRSAENG